MRVKPGIRYIVQGPCIVTPVVGDTVGHRPETLGKKQVRLEIF